MGSHIVFTCSKSRRKILTLFLEGSYGSSLQILCNSQLDVLNNYLIDLTMP